MNFDTIGSLFADVGCGNGKNIPSCYSKGFAIGSDFSVGLINVCREKVFEVNVSDALRIPYRSNCFDAVLSIAVLHHISSESRRIKLLAENMRILKKGGCALFYAWAYEQHDDKSKSGHKFKQQDVLVPFHRKPKFIQENGGGSSEDKVEDHSDDSAHVYQRYCHVYRKGELESLFLHQSLKHWVAVEASYYDTGNWCILARKHGCP